MSQVPVLYPHHFRRQVDLGPPEKLREEIGSWRDRGYPPKSQKGGVTDMGML